MEIFENYLELSYCKRMHVRNFLKKFFEIFQIVPPPHETKPGYAPECYIYFKIYQTLNKTGFEQDGKIESWMKIHEYFGGKQLYFANQFKKINSP